MFKIATLTLILSSAAAIQADQYITAIVGGAAAIILFVIKSEITRVRKHVEDNSIHKPTSECVKQIISCEKKFEKTDENINAVHHRFDELLLAQTDQNREIIEAIKDLKK